MPVVYDLIDDLVDEHEVLPYALLVEHAAVVPEHLHHAVDDVHHEGRRDVVLRGGHEVDPKFLREEVVQSLDVLDERFV